MEWRILISIITLLVSAGFAAADEPAYKEGELLVRFADKDVQSSIEKIVGTPMSTRAVRSTISNLIVTGARVDKEYDRIVPGLSLVKLPAGMTVEEAVLQFNLSPAVLYAEPNHKYKLLQTIPNDPYFWQLWAMNNTGLAGGTADADIDAPEAWDIEHDAPDIVVAVTDTGIDYTHEDLAGNMWINPGEDMPDLGVVDGNDFNEVDDDLNYYVDDIYGFDPAGETMLNPFDADADPMDPFGHGTHVAGTIGAVGNNLIGVTGVCWDVNLMAVKIFADDSEDEIGAPQAVTSDIIIGIQYIIDKGAKVINASWGNYIYSPALYDVISAARDAGILFVAAAGNDGTDNDSIPIYPASYDLDNIISVMATDWSDQVPIIYSNYGVTSVDLAAPGGFQYYAGDPGGILSCVLDNGYAFMYGTSMAAPHVSGAAALIWSVNPNLTYTGVKGIILHSVDKPASLQGLCVTGGRLNLFNAVKMARGGLVRNTKNTPNPGDDTFHPTIQEAIDNASDDDELIARRDRWYLENIDFLGLRITVRSGDVNNPNDPNFSSSDTFISGLVDSGRVVTFQDGEGVETILRGFTIRDGASGGIYCDGSSPTISDCIITANTQAQFGGGIYCRNDSDPNITNCTIRNNTATDDGGGIYCESASDPNITNCTISNNTASGNHGGGIYCSDCSPAITGCTVSGNIAMGSGYRDGGGGIYCDNASPTISECEITDNTANYQGGGIYCANNSEPNIINNTISNNTGSYWGGGIYCCDSSPVIKNCLIINNSANRYDGGGIYLENSLPAISNCTIANNTVNELNGLGGGLFCYDSSEPVVKDCIFSDNSNHGIALWENGIAVPDITFCLFYNNDGYDYYEYEPDAGFNYPSAPDPDGNFHKDPMFVRGRLSNYYLSQYTAGQILDHNGEVADPISDANSPAVNAGSDTAANLGLGMGDPNYSTRTDNVADSGTVDIGYHYKDTLPAAEYQLYTYVIGNGSITPSGINSYPQYTQVLIEAANDVDPDYQFKSWSGTDDDSRIDDVDQDGRPDPYQLNVVTMNSNKSVGAVFETSKIQLITSVSGEPGRITPSTHAPRFYPRGEVVNLYAEPENRSHVIIWTGTDDDYSTSRYNTVTMLEDPEIVNAEFYAPQIIPVAGDWTAIQLAIYNAHDRDIVQIQAGTYSYEPGQHPDGDILEIDGKAITLTSTNPDDPDVVADTVIDGRLVISNVGRNTVIQGLTIQNPVDVEWFMGDPPPGPGNDGISGIGCEGGGMTLVGSASPDVRNCVFDGCYVWGAHGSNGNSGIDFRGSPGNGGWAGWAHGGAVSCGSGSSPIFKNCSFVDCWARGGDGGNGANDDAWGGHGGNWSEKDYWDETSWIWDYGPFLPHWKYSGYGGAIYCYPFSSPEFVDCTFTNNHTYGGSCGISGQPYMATWPLNHYKIDSFGGAVYAAEGSSPSFTDCVFTDNEADIAGPNSHVQDGEIPINYDLYISYGGAIAFEDGATPFFDNCTFNGSLATIGGAMWGNWSELQIDNCSLVDNSAYHGGGVLFAGGTAKIARSDFSENDATGQVGQGGAICSLGANAMIIDCNISNNYANGTGGGIYISSKDIDGSEVAGDNTVLVKSCLISGNTAARDGAGISANWYSDPNITNCTIADNIVTGSGFEDGYGGGVYCCYGNYTNIIDSIIWGNSAEIGEQIATGTSYEYDPRPSTVKVSYSDVQGGAEGVYVDTGDPGTQADDSVLDWDYATNLTGTSATDPRFVFVYYWGNYYLSQIAAGQDSNSPCVDKGSDDAYSLDMYRHTTRTDRVPEDLDSIVDMGYHYVLTADIVGDYNFDGIVDSADLGIFMRHWLKGGCDFPYWCHGTDLNQDGVVDNFDYAIFAENYGEVETTPPIPNPMTWAVAPASVGTNSITMTATTAIDNSGYPVLYYFQRTDVNGIADGIFRAWDPCSTYIDTSVDTDVTYGYRVKATDYKHRDPTDPNDPLDPSDPSAPFNVNDPEDPNIGNWGKWSVIGYAIAGVLEDITPPSPAPTISSYTATPNSITLFATTATDISGVEYYFEDFDNPPWNSGWIDVPTWTDTGLDPNTTYRYRVMARDKSSNRNETAWSELFSATTLEEGQIPPPPPPPDTTPPLPNPSLWSPTATLWTGTGYPQQYSAVDPNTGFGSYWHRMEAVVASDATTGGSDPVWYYFECYQGNGLDSGWQLSPIYDYQVGAPMICKYRVKTCDAVGNEGQWSEVWPTQ